MKIKPDERQQISEICREELEKATRRISERLGQFECQAPADTGGRNDALRRFYEDLTERPWTDDDERCLDSLRDNSEDDIKRMMRDAFRLSTLLPVPSFAYLLKVLKKAETEPSSTHGFQPRNPDAMSAADRERLATLLSEELADVVKDLASRLELGENKAAMIRARLEEAEGRIIGRFTPLA